MLHKNIKTKKSKLILQVYHNYFVYGKNMKSYSDRKEITEWKDEIKTRSPFLNNGKLNLSKSDYNPDLMNCDLIIINDFNSKSELKAIENQMNKLGYH